MINRAPLYWLANIARVWERWWTRDSYPHTMGIVRIAFGAWLLFYWGLRLPYVDILYSSTGIVFPKPPVYLPDSLTWLFIVPSPHIAFGIYAIHLLALFLLTIGIHIRLSAGTAFVISWYYFYLNNHLFHTSFDRLYIAVLLFLMISDAAEVFSVQAWRQYGSPLQWKKMVSIFPQRLIAFQICMTYFGVGFQKLWLPGWQGGEMLWYSLMGVWGTPAAFWITSFGWSPIYHVAVNLTKLFECFWPIGFWIKHDKIRWVAFVTAALFHIFVDVLLYIWWFAILIPAYIVYFEPEETYAFLKKISKGKIT